VNGDRISGMAPGPELNEKIAVELLGLTIEQYRQKSLDYSAYLVPAFQHVVGAMIGLGYVLRVRPDTKGVRAVGGASTPCNPFWPGGPFFTENMTLRAKRVGLARRVVNYRTGVPEADDGGE